MFTGTSLPSSTHASPAAARFTGIAIACDSEDRPGVWVRILDIDPATNDMTVEVFSTLDRGTALGKVPSSHGPLPDVPGTTQRAGMVLVLKGGESVVVPY